MFNVALVNFKTINAHAVEIICSKKKCELGFLSANMLLISIIRISLKTAIALRLVCPSFKASIKKPGQCDFMATDSLQNLSEAELSDIVQMALSDHVSFAQIKLQYGLAEKEVKALMRNNLKPGSYRAWRKRVRTFSDRRSNYK